jgi:DNA-binding transcriptional ArsR family regulator
MKAVYIVNDTKVAMVLIDPLRRAILNLLSQKPMTQAQLAYELGLSGASLNYHIKILRTRKLVVVASREIERHRLTQIFFLAAAYLFVYDLDSLPKHLARYFFPVSLERARAIISMLILNDHIQIDQTVNISNSLSELLSRHLVKAAKANEQKEVDYAHEKIIYEIYTKAISKLLDKNKDLLLTNKMAMNIHNK